MADPVLISALPAAAALDNADVMEIEQGTDPTNTSGKITLALLKAFFTGTVANRFVSFALSDLTTALTTGTGEAFWYAPENGTLVSVFIGVDTQSSSGVVTVDMNDSGGTVFTTPPSIDAMENTSLTGTPAVLDGTVTFVKGDKFTFDIDAAGTGAKGLQACVEYTPG